MTNSLEQREIFWKLFEEILGENGNPFKISYIHQITNEVTSYAAVNRKGSFNSNAVDLSFVLREHKFRVNIYISSARLMKKFMDNKDAINSMVTLPIIWDNGKRVLRPSVYFNFIENDKEEYRKVIKESFSTVLEFIEVAKKYGNEELFDF